MLPRPPRLASLAAAALVCAAVTGAGATSLLGCGGAAILPGGAGDAAVLADIDTRLHGAWRLQSFVPVTPLEPMLQAFVTFQYGNLTVRLERGRFVADSPGVHLSRAYRLHDAYGDRFKLTSFDEQGVPYDAECTFLQPDVLQVNSWTDPWRGVATFQRAAGGNDGWPPQGLPPR
jgi:hypothetical protein